MGAPAGLHVSVVHVLTRPLDAKEPASMGEGGFKRVAMVSPKATIRIMKRLWIILATVKRLAGKC